jgi:hypothetical protein
MYRKSMDGLHEVLLKRCTKKRFCSPTVFYLRKETITFTKTGSGQTSGKHSKKREMRFLAGPATAKTTQSQ